MTKNGGIFMISHEALSELLGLDENHKIVAARGNMDNFKDNIDNISVALLIHGPNLPEVSEGHSFPLLQIGELPLKKDV